jgi:hypothetical protein
MPPRPSYQRAAPAAIGIGSSERVADCHARPLRARPWPSGALRGGDDLGLELCGLALLSLPALIIDLGLERVRERDGLVGQVAASDDLARVAAGHRWVLTQCSDAGLGRSSGSPFRWFVSVGNGKAERFIRTLLNDWVYGHLYADSDERARALPLWLTYYNYRRPHGSLGHQPPSSRLNNVSRNYT